ncbi:MAG: xylose isomerase [Planctomycetaceae bacterium]|nr:MAG: xylose isomerase [Planctomycetaceae bacterium]
MPAPLPLSYCTNVHPGRTVDEVLQGLRQYTQAIRERTGDIAAGLWLAWPVIHALQDMPQREHWHDALKQLGLICYTLNTFPFGDFHADRVKDAVYRPDWSDPRRLEYTLKSAQLLAEMLPPSAEGSLSTLPLAYKPHVTDRPALMARCTDLLLEAACQLQALEQRTGRCIRLGLEPEPLCLLETTDEVLSFFEQLCQAAAHKGCEEIVRDKVGICFDVCHQAVEFEDPVESLRRLSRAGLRVVKLHLSSALHINHPYDPANREALAAYVEPRYLHQTSALTQTGVHWWPDLDMRLLADPPEPFLQARAWRVHFHVPIHAAQWGPLSTTQRELQAAFQEVLTWPSPPHLEIETYTWPVLTDGEQFDLITGMSQELLTAQRWLADFSNSATESNTT